MLGVDGNAVAHDGSLRTRLHQAIADRWLRPLRNSVAVVPRWRRRQAARCWLDGKPSAWATTVIDSRPAVIRSAASQVRRKEIHAAGDHPVKDRNRRLNTVAVSPASAARVPTARRPSVIAASMLASEEVTIASGRAGRCSRTASATRARSKATAARSVAGDTAWTRQATNSRQAAARPALPHRTIVPSRRRSPAKRLSSCLVKGA